MNRSILIVICDFIITSMIYLNGGFSAIESTFRDGGGATLDRATVQTVLAELIRQRDTLDAERRELIHSGNTQNRRLEELTAQLAQTRARIEFMERRVRLNRDNSGPLSAGELRKELETEIGRTALAETRYEQLEAELQRYRENLRKNDSNFAALQTQHASLLRELEARRREIETRARSLEETRTQLGTSRQELAASRQELAALTERLASREAELTRREGDLSATRNALSSAKASSDDYRKRLGSTEADLAFLRGRSSAMEKELASNRDRLEALQKVVKTRDIELAAAKTRLDNMEKVLKNAVSDLSQTRDRLSGESKRREEAQTQLTQLKGDYNTVSAKLQNAEAKLRSDVLTRYTGSALRLRRSIREKRLLADRTETSDLYLPAVKIGDRNYLISTLRTLTGALENNSTFGEVTALNYLAAVPNPADHTGAVRLEGPLLVEKSDCRVALLEVPGKMVEPLTILTRDELKQRGIQDLYLFKTTSFGKDSTILDKRCSMSFESDDDYLYIRNGARVSSELKAEPGDLVLTKQGELAAVVVAQEEYDFGRQLEARCFTFGRLPDPGALPTVELVRTPGQVNYRDFSDKVNFWLEQAKPLDARKRRR